MGVGQSDPSFAGNRLGHLAVLALAVKIANEFDSDVHFEVVHGNSGAEKSVRLSDLTLVDTQSWINVKKREKLRSLPMWGHL